MSIGWPVGWPADMTWYKLLTDWGSIIAGLLALVAGGLAYKAGRAQVAEIRRAVQRRKWAYTAIAALEAKRLQAEAKRQERLVADANPEEENVEVRYILSRIEIREVLRSEWEQLGLLERRTALSIYNLINAIDGFNITIAHRDELFRGTALQLLCEIETKADCASKLLQRQVSKA